MTARSPSARSAPSTLAALAPRRGELLWDIGAGSGSVAIEWMLAHPSTAGRRRRARSPNGAQRIRRNAAACGVPGSAVVGGRRPPRLPACRRRTRSSSAAAAATTACSAAVVDALKPGGRLVANAVTLEMEAVLLAHRERLGGELTRLAVARAAPVGSMHGWRPAMPVTQWTWVKP